MSENRNAVDALRPKRPISAQLADFFIKKPLGATGAVILVLLIVTALLADFVGTHERDMQDVNARLLEPSSEH